MEYVIFVSGLLILGLILLISLFFIDDNSSLFVVFAIVGAMLVFLSVIIMGTVFTTDIYYKKYEEVKITEYTKSKYKVYVDVCGKNLTYDDKKTYDEINDKTKFYKITHYNYYKSEKKIEYDIEFNVQCNNQQLGKIIKK